MEEDLDALLEDDSEFLEVSNQKAKILVSLKNLKYKEYRRSRLEQINAAASKETFGAMRSVTADNFIEEVENTSKSRDFWVSIITSMSC